MKNEKNEYQIEMQAGLEKFRKHCAVLPQRTREQENGIVVISLSGDSKNLIAVNAKTGVVMGRRGADAGTRFEHGSTIEKRYKWLSQDAQRTQQVVTALIQDTKVSADEL